MAEENVNLTYPNFCMSPIIGNIVTIHGEDTLRTKNISNGALLYDYTLSDSISNSLLCLEYVGPRNLSAMMDGLSFFTIERVSSSSCLIKRWETALSTSSLELKSTITKNTSGVHRYDIISGCIEYYNRLFDGATTSGVNYINLNDSSRISSGNNLFLGPSADMDSLGLGESVVVDYVVGNTVYLTSNITNEYLSGDQVSFYNYAYLFSALGYNGNLFKGTLFKINADTGAVSTPLYSGQYKSVSTTKWFPNADAIGSVVNTNMLLISPYNLFQNWRSMSMNNLEDDKTTLIEINDLAFDGNSIYKLMNKKTEKDGSGTEVTISWATYNYQKDSFVAYVNSIQMFTDKCILIGSYDYTYLTVIVKDQFGVGMLGVDVSVERDGGDSGGVFDPPHGVLETDANGVATIKYTSGLSYTGLTKITCNCLGGNVDSGSVYVWDNVYIDSKMSCKYLGHIFQTCSGISSEYETLIKQIQYNFSTEYKIFCKSYFSSNGGDWINPSPFSSEVPSYVPMLIVSPLDGPSQSFFGWLSPAYPGGGHLIRQVEDFESDVPIQQVGPAVGYMDRIKQIAEAVNDLQISQSKSSYHNLNWPTHEASISQFIFVTEAIPAFWSEKNPIDTDIWIRLLPYAASLNLGSLKFYIREVSYAGDTGYIDMASYLTVSGINQTPPFGLDVTCDPPTNFHYDAVVYVRIEVYDLAPIPNFIWLDYWFTIIPDYRAPYIDNLNPSREQENVSIDSEIYFEIKDEEIGVDIDTLELHVNSRRVYPTSVIKVSENHYNVTYVPSSNFFYDKTVLVNVKVADISPNSNYLNDSYRFYTAESSDVLFDDVDNIRCKRGMGRYSNIRMLVLASGSGVDKDSIRVQVLEREATDKFRILPIIYRL